MKLLSRVSSRNYFHRKQKNFIFVKIDNWQRCHEYLTRLKEWKRKKKICCALFTAVLRQTITCSQQCFVAVEFIFFNNFYYRQWNSIKFIDFSSMSNRLYIVCYRFYYVIGWQQKYISFYSSIIIDVPATSIWFIKSKWFNFNKRSSTWQCIVISMRIYHLCELWHEFIYHGSVRPELQTISLTDDW